VNSDSTKLFRAKMTSGDENLRVGHKFPGKTVNKAKAKEK